MPRSLNLNAYLYFETVARRGTVARAAEELTISPSAVSQQIKLLEQHLGLRLFRRDGRVLSLTLDGEQLFQASSTSLRDLRNLERSLGRTHDIRRLNLRVTPSLGVQWLGPRLSGFVTLHPDLELRVDAAPDPTDFERELIDLEIRYGTGQWDDYEAGVLLQDHVLPLCSPIYLAALPIAAKPAMVFDSTRLIASTRALCQWDLWLLRNGIETQGNSKKILIDRSSMALQLALDGAGIVLESLALAAPEVIAGRLVPVAPELPILSFPAYWTFCPSRHLKRRAVRLFLDWLGSQKTAHDADIAEITKHHGLTTTEIDIKEIASYGSE